MDPIFHYIWESRIQNVGRRFKKVSDENSLAKEIRFELREKAVENIFLPFLVNSD